MCFTSREISPSLRYFHRKYNLPAIQIVKNLKHEQVDNGIEIRRTGDYLSQLKM